MTVPSGRLGGPVHLDHNATTPVDPRVVEACLPYLTEHFGNPSSSHAYGQGAHGAAEPLARLSPTWSPPNTTQQPISTRTPVR